MKIVLIIIYSIIALAVTVLTLIQSNDDEGASSTITGGSGSFLEKNKGNTDEPLLRKGKTTHGSNSTKIGEFAELRTKSGKFWMRGSYEVNAK